MELTPGTWLGPYRVDAHIARGGMGSVYRASRADGAVVALKVLPEATRPEHRARFEREAQLAARLSHPSIVRIHAAGIAQGVHYIAMDFIEGEPLSTRCGRLAPAQAVRLVAQVARAIEHAHAHGVLHRDIKPSNVLVRGDDALITDFGVARAVEGSSLTKTGALVGTPTHMAPEQVTGQPVTAATDVHALGVLLHEALTGSSPFQRDTLQAVMVAVTSVVAAPPSTLRPEVPPALDRLVLAALQKSPERRPTAAAVAAALDDLAAGRTPRAAPRRALRAALIAALLLTIAGAGAALRTPAPEHVPAPTPTPTSVAAPTSARPAPVGETPSWLRALEAGGDLEPLRAAATSLRGDALLAVDAPTRARGVRALEGLDRTWRDPRVGASTTEGAADMIVAFQRLVFIQTLWRRLDPDHRLPPARDAVLNEMIVLGGIRPENAATVLPALVDVFPDALHVHATYAQNGDLEHEVEPLRHGLVLSDAAQDQAARHEMTVRLANLLVARSGEADVARADAARAELDALLADSLERARRGEPRADETALKLLHLTANQAIRERRFDVALRALELAVPLDGQPWRTQALLLDVHVAAYAGDSAESHRTAAVGALQETERLAARFDDAATTVSEHVLDVASLFTRERRWYEARGLLEGALAVLDGNRGAETALIRTVILAQYFPDDVDDLAAALEDLTTRLPLRRRSLERRNPLDPTNARQLEALQALVRDASAKLARGELDRVALAAALDQHPGRALLSPTFKNKR